jgi:choline dehydrogenase
VPEGLRSTFSNSTLKKLASFPDDWPEVEYISMSGFLGYQHNFIRDAPTDGYNYATVSTALVAPLSRGTINIMSDDTKDPPIINPNWLSDPADREVLIAGFKRTRQLFQSDAMQPILIGEEYFPGNAVQTDEEILALIRKATSTVFHAAATCAMGKRNDSNAVVDTKARVFGVNNLRVVDASAFPILPPGHPTATVCKHPFYFAF